MTERQVRIGRIVGCTATVLWAIYAVAAFSVGTAQILVWITEAAGW